MHGASQAAGSHPAASSPFRVGDRVQVCGLTSAAGLKLNGLLGVVQGHAESGRFCVRIDNVVGVKFLQLAAAGFLLTGERQDHCDSPAVTRRSLSNQGPLRRRGASRVRSCRPRFAASRRSAAAFDHAPAACLQLLPLHPREGCRLCKRLRRTLRSPCSGEA
jgi:hypothetical protein